MYLLIRLHAYTAIAPIFCSLYFHDLAFYCSLFICDFEVLGPVLELGDVPQKNRKEGIFVIPVLILSKKFYTSKPTYRKNTDIP